MDSNDRDRTANPGLGVRSAFVVHVHPDSVASRDQARGRIEHVPTGRSSPFTGLDEMLGFMRCALATDDGAAARGDSVAMGSISGKAENLA